MRGGFVLTNEALAYAGFVNEAGAKLFAILREHTRMQALIALLAKDDGLCRRLVVLVEAGIMFMSVD